MLPRKTRVLYQEAPIRIRAARVRYQIFDGQSPIRIREPLFFLWGQHSVAVYAGRTGGRQTLGRMSQYYMARESSTRASFTCLISYLFSPVIRVTCHGMGTLCKLVQSYDVVRMSEGPSSATILDYRWKLALRVSQALPQNCEQSVVYA
jgi:hypothetical protein